MATFVLIHGRHLGGWAWKSVEALLCSSGHTVFRPSLTGCAERSHLTGSVTVETHIADITNLLMWEDLHDVILCGHSYAAVVVKAVADRMPDRLAAIVYVDGLIPENGQSARVVRDTPPRIFAPEAPRVFQRGSEANAYVKARLGVFPEQCFDEPASFVGRFRDVPRKLYIRSGLFSSPALDRLFEQALEDAEWDAVRVAAGHNAMIDNPEAIAEVLIAAVR